MSSREGWQGTAKVPTDPPTESPNRQDDFVSAHIRVYWPYTASYDDILDAIDAAWWEAVKGVRDKINPCSECFGLNGRHKMDCVLG